MYWSWSIADSLKTGGIPSLSAEYLSRPWFAGYCDMVVLVLESGRIRRFWCSYEAVICDLR
jgi:hypothetical protein